MRLQAINLLISSASCHKVDQFILTECHLNIDLTNNKTVIGILKLIMVYTKIDKKLKNLFSMFVCAS